jgi:hypothetical protein
MTVPTPLIVLAGLLLVALILRLLVPSGVFTSRPEAHRAGRSTTHFA